MQNHLFSIFSSENQLVIVGGHDRGMLSNVEVLDENKRLSCNIPSYPLQLEEHSSTVTSSGILVCGANGLASGKYHNDCYEYRAVSNSWVKMPWIPATKFRFDMITLKGKVWAVGGSIGRWTSSAAQSTMDIIDYNTSTWTRQWLPVQIVYHCLTKLSPNQFILIGGDQNNRVSKNVMMKIFQKMSVHLSNKTYLYNSS